MKRNVIAVGLLLIVGLVLGGCTLQPNDQEAVKQLVSQIDLTEFLVGSTDSDLFTQDDTTAQSFTTQAIPEGTYARRANYTRGEVTRTIGEVLIVEETGIATAEVALTINGEFNLSDIDGNLVGTKPANLTGQAIYTAQKVDNKWKIIGKEMRLTTHAEAPVFNDLQVAFMTATDGDQQIRVKTAITGDTGERFKAAAYNRAAKLRTRLVDNGNPFRGDDLANDGIYSGLMEQEDAVAPGKYLGTLKAVGLWSLLNLEKDDAGNFTSPVKMALEVFVVEVPAAQ